VVVTDAAKKLLEDALALPDDARRRIAELLLDSLSTDGTAESEAAWVAEAVRRANELERGEVEALDGESVLEDLKSKFQSAAP
jgi:putative addiction module component (TIGR02574 family)